MVKYFILFRRLIKYFLKSIEKQRVTWLFNLYHAAGNNVQMINGIALHKWVFRAMFFLFLHEKALWVEKINLIQQMLTDGQTDGKKTPMSDLFA